MQEARYPDMEAAEQRLGALRASTVVPLPYLAAPMRITPPYDPVAELLKAYLDCALWSSTHPDTNGTSLDQCGYSVRDMTPDAIARAQADCAAFLAANDDDIGTDLDQAGHDFWLTRNRHGAGFWDGDWPEPAATRLTDAAHAAGEIVLYPGDDGLLYFS